MSEKDPSGNVNETSGDVNESATKSVSYESHQKLLREKKEIQTKLSEMNSRLESFENEKLEKETDLKKALDSYKEKALKAEEGKKKMFKNFTDKFVKNQFNRMADKMGCIDPELAYAAVDMSDVELDEEFTFDEESFAAKLEGLQKKKPHLFKKDVSGPRDTTPNGNPKDIDIKNLSLEESWKMLAKIK